MQWNGDKSDDVFSQKIRVAYLPPEGQTVPEEEEEHPRHAGLYAEAHEPPAASALVRGVSCFHQLTG